MKKEIKKIGNSIGVIFNKEEQKVEDLKVNDIVDIELVKLKVKKRWK